MEMISLYRASIGGGEGLYDAISPAMISLLIISHLFAFFIIISAPAIESRSWLCSHVKMSSFLCRRCHLQ